MIHSPTKTFIMKTSNFAWIWFGILAVIFSSAIILGRVNSDNPDFQNTALYGIDSDQSEPVVLAEVNGGQPGDDLIYQLCFSRCGDPTLVINQECWVQCRMFYHFRKR